MSAPRRPPDDRGPSLAGRVAAFRPLRRPPRAPPAPPAPPAPSPRRPWLAIALLAPPLATIAAAAVMTIRADRSARPAPAPMPDARVAALTRPTASATLAMLATLLPADATLHAIDATGPLLAIEVETADPAALRAALAARGRTVRTVAEAPGLAGVRVRLEVAG